MVVVVVDLIALVESAESKGLFGPLCGLGTFLTNVGLTVVTVVANSGRMILKAGLDLKLGLNNLSLALCELLVSCGLTMLG